MSNVNVNSSSAVPNIPETSVETSAANERKGYLISFSSILYALFNKKLKDSDIEANYIVIGCRPEHIFNNRFPNELVSFNRVKSRTISSRDGSVDEIELDPYVVSFWKHVKQLLENARYENRLFEIKDFRRDDGDTYTNPGMAEMLVVRDHRAWYGEWYKKENVGSYYVHHDTTGPGMEESACDVKETAF